MFLFRMDTIELNKATWKPKFVSEFSMGQFDFERYNDWLKNTEKYSAEINSTDSPGIELIQNYFACLNVLWKSWRPIVAVPSKVEEIDKAIAECRALKRFWEDSRRSNFPVNLPKIRQIVDALDAVHTKLMETKQLVGLGIVVKKNMDTKEKIRAGMRRGYYNDLPEP